MIRLYTILFFICLFQLIHAQGPQVVSVSPAPLYNAVPIDAVITADLDRPLDPASVNASTVKVFGRWSGPASGQLSLENDNRRIRFVPDEPFFAGEWITIELTKGIQSADGDRLKYAYIWNGWAATKPGSLQQEWIETIELRQPGEGLIQAYGAYAGDLNNDGHSDLTVINETSDDLRIMLNDGQGHYDDMEIFPMGSMTPSPSEGADFDGDGEIDLAVSTAHDSEVRVLMGDGMGSFSSLDRYTTGFGARGLVVIDCDGDGHDDLFITNRLSDDMNLLINDGTGAFTVSDLDLAGTGETACAVADANSDGIPDIFVGFYQSKELGILLGDGDGGFTLSDKISVLGRPWMIAASDLNGDGYADVASANSDGNITAVAFGDGSGNLGQPTYLLSDDHRFPLAIDLGDLDGDGDLDIVTSNYSSANYSVFENDGSGQFSAVDELPSPDKSSCAILHDRDNDGDLDITATDEGADVVVLFENGGPTLRIDPPDDDLHFELTPNPTGGMSTVSFTLRESALVTIELFDVSGKRMGQLLDEKLPEGPHEFQLTGEGAIPTPTVPGIYFCRIKANDQVGSRRLVVK